MIPSNVRVFVCPEPQDMATRATFATMALLHTEHRFAAGCPQRNWMMWSRALHSRPWPPARSTSAFVLLTNSNVRERTWTRCGSNASNGLATSRSVRRGSTPPSSQKTDWSPEHWRRAGKPSCRLSGTSARNTSAIKRKCPGTSPKRKGHRTTGGSPISPMNWRCRSPRCILGCTVDG